MAEGQNSKFTTKIGCGDQSRERSCEKHHVWLQFLFAFLWFAACFAAVCCPRWGFCAVCWVFLLFWDRKINMKFVKNGYMYRKLAERLGKAPPPPNLMEAPISESLLKSIPKSSDYVAIAFDEGTRNCGLSVLNKNLEDIHPFSVLKKKAGQVGWFALKDMLLREFKDDQVPCFIFGYPASKETPAGYILDLIKFLDKQPEFDDILYTFVNEDYTTKASKKLMFWADMDEEDINKGNLELPRIDWETTFSRKLHSWVNEDGKLVLPTSKVTLDYSNKNRKDLWSSYLIMELFLAFKHIDNGVSPPPPNNT
ncbi:hypothetical protein Q3G72_009557 [Acer saccharum]|nr:hypothetical protein Q3G72_009557 [Acer saccharum]